MRTATERGQAQFADAWRSWEAHLAQTPTDVGDLLLLFEKLRAHVDALARDARRFGYPWGWDEKEAFRAAAEERIKAEILEWLEIADRDRDVFEKVIADYVPAATRGLIFPNDPPAVFWHLGAFEILSRAFPMLARDLGLEAVDRPAPQPSVPAIAPAASGRIAS